MDIRKYLEMGVSLPLGISGENGIESYEFGYGDWASSYGEGVLSINHQRPGDSSPYPVGLTVSGHIAHWDVTAADVQYSGHGRIQVVYAVNGVMKKTMTGTTVIEPSLGENVGADPAIQSYIDTMVEIKDEAYQSMVTAVNAKDVAVQKAQDVLGLTAEATVNNTVGTPSVDVAVTQDGDHKKMSFSFENLKGEPGRDYSEIFVTPEMFGAMGDGVTDDTNAFLSAINSGKPVYVPNGTYILSESIELKAGVTICGSGAHGNENDGGYVDTVLKFTGGNGFIVTGNQVTIKDMRIVGSGTGNGIATVLLTASDIPVISKIILSNLWMIDFDVAINMNVYLSDFSMINVYNCTKGFRFIRGTSIKLYGCYAASCDYGYEIGAVYSTLINCACDHSSECCYTFTKDAKNIQCIALGAENFTKKLVVVTQSYNIIIDSLVFFTNSNTETDGIIYLNNANYTSMRHIFDRLLTDGTSPIQKYLYVNYGFGNKIEDSNISNAISKSDLTLGGAVRNKAIIELLPTNTSGDADVTFSVTGNDLVTKVIPSMHAYEYDGNVQFNITDLSGNLNYNSYRNIEYVNSIKKVIITTNNPSNNIFDTGENWTTVRKNDAVIEFKDLVMLPYSLPSITRPYFRISNAKVIFTNCDFSQTNPQGKQSQNMVICAECATVIFNNCTLPSDPSKLYTKDDTCTVLGV